MTRTKAEIECLLKSYGVKGVRWTSLEGQDDVLEFIAEATIRGVKRTIGISVKPPHIYIKKKRNGRLVDTENPNQEYRLLFYWIKSKIEAVTWGLSTIEKEFLSEITTALPDGRVTSVGEIVIDLMGQNKLSSLPFMADKRTRPELEQRETVIDGETVP
jgi:hypothetical protein